MTVGPPGSPARRRALLATVVSLVAAAAALAGAGALGWARVGFHDPLRGQVPVQVAGGQLVPALGPLALLALAAVAAVLATGGWVRRLLGTTLLVVALAPLMATTRVGDHARLVHTARAAGQLPARTIPDGAVTVLPAGPALATVGTLLLAASGVVLVLRGHRMPRMGARYRAPGSRRGPSGSSPVAQGGERELWDRMDAGEDPTAQGDPR